MVEMIPDFISPDVKSSAEKKLFNTWKTDEVDDRIIILHSLGLSDHLNNIFGEIDFVVISKYGVLCVEVKGGDVSREKGVWKFTNRYGHTESKQEGPFQQAQGNMASLRQHLKKRVGNRDGVIRCQYACCVVMPDKIFSDDGVDIIREVLFDKSHSMSLESILRRSFTYWSDLCDRKHGFRGSGLSNEDMDRLITLLRGDFKFVPSIKDNVDNITKELCALTDEQYEILEALSDNPRMLVSGVAGAGKTLIAIEQVRRAHEEGKSVLYVCFNRNISAYVQYKLEKEYIPVESKTLHAIMENTCGDRRESEKDDYYFTEVLPARFLMEAKPQKVDYLIVDEGQDLLKGRYLDCLDMLVNGGIENGNWLVLYDPNQNLYKENDELDTCLKKLKQKATSYRLTVNCRNTKQIADANVLMTGISDLGKAKVRGPKVKYIPYSSGADEREKLIGVLAELNNEGVPGSDYILLSKHNISNNASCLCGYELPAGYGTIKAQGQMWRAKRNEVRYATIYSFKGLESKVVILLDVDDYRSQEATMMNYVGISRATSMLYIFYDEATDHERQEMIVKGYALLK